LTVTIALVAPPEIGQLLCHEEKKYAPLVGAVETLTLEPKV
jgi:hypothetical protein